MIRTGAFLGVVLFAAGASGAEEKVVITRADCQRIVRHVPSADVAYQPGVDVHGRKVVGADLPDSGASLQVIPDVLEFKIGFNPASGRVAALNESSTTIGTVKYDLMKGTFTYNGQPMGAADQSALAEACRKRGVK